MLCQHCGVKFFTPEEIRREIALIREIRVDTKIADMLEFILDGSARASITDDSLLTIAEVSRLTGISRTTIYQYLRRGKLKGVKNGAGKFMVTKDSVNGLRFVTLDEFKSISPTYSNTKSEIRS